MEQIVANLTGKARRETRGGRLYFVAPLTLIREGVLPGSMGPLFYGFDQIAQSIEAWNGRPITAGHPPEGVPIALSADYWLEHAIGQLFDAAVDNGKKSGRAVGWFDAEATRRIDERIYSALERGEKIRVSTGLVLDAVPAEPGAVWNGRTYTHTTRNYRPGHLAVLVGEAAACDLHDGCGVNNAKHTPMKKLLLALGRILRLVKEEKQEETRPAEAAPEVTAEKTAEVPAMNKAQLIDWLVANCDCHKQGGKAELENISEATLARMKAGAEKHAEAVANAAKPAETQPAPSSAELDTLKQTIAALNASVQSLGADIQAIKAQGEQQAADAKQAMIDALVSNVADETARKDKAARLQSATPEVLAMWLAERGQQIPQMRPNYLGAAGGVVNAGQKSDVDNLLPDTDDSVGFDDHASPALRRKASQAA